MAAGASRAALFAGEYLAYMYCSLDEAVSGIRAIARDSEHLTGVSFNDLYRAIDSDGHGYATEAATATIDWAFEALGWDEVIHTIEAANVNSQKVAERLGSRILRQAVLPPPMNVPVDVWGQTRAEWLGRRG